MYEEVIVFGLAVVGPVLGFCLGFLAGWVGNEPPFGL